VIIDDFDIISVALGPSEADTPLIIKLKGHPFGKWKAPAARLGDGDRGWGLKLAFSIQKLSRGMSCDNGSTLKKVCCDIFAN
jgi:hypothetical protein